MKRLKADRRSPPDATTIAAPSADTLAAQIRRDSAAFPVPPAATPSLRPSSESDIAGATSESRSNQNAAEKPLGKVLARSLALQVLAWLAVLYTLYMAREILFPVALAIVLCLLLRPPVRWLTEWRVPLFLSAAVIELALVATVALGISQLLGPAQSWVDNSGTHLARIEERLKPITMSLSEFREASKKVDDLANGDEDGAVRVVEEKPGLASLMLSTTGSVLGIVAVVLVLLYFLLASGDSLLNKIVEVVPTFQGKRDAVAVARGIEGGVSSYLFTFTIINICLGTVEGIAMWLLDMPNPALWGVMAGALNFIPFLGPMCGAAIVGLVALAQFESIGSALLVPLVFIAITTLEGNFITPTIFGRSMQLNPVMVILSLVFWGWIWGVGGALLAVPILAAAKIACERLEDLQPIGRFLSG